MQALPALALLHVRMSSMVLYQEAILVKEFFSTLMYSPVKYCWYNTEIGRVEVFIQNLTHMIRLLLFYITNVL